MKANIAPGSVYPEYMHNLVNYYRHIPSQPSLHF